MKNLRITKIITALIIIIWVPSSFATSPNLFKVMITNGTSQVNFIYGVQRSSDGNSNLKIIKYCKNHRSRNCQHFWAISLENYEQSNDQLFRELKIDWREKRPLTEKKNIDLMLMSIIASLEKFPPANLINGMNTNSIDENLDFRQEVIVPVAVKDVWLKSIYPEDISKPDMRNFYIYLSKLKMVKRITYDITSVNDINIRIEVEDKIIIDLINNLDYDLKYNHKAFESAAFIFLSLY